MADNTEGPRSLDVTTNVDELVRPAQDAYMENEDHVPDPLHLYGTLDTSDTAGGAHQRIEEVSPTFSAARARNLVTAARALDPNDDEVSEDLVVLPDDGRTADDGRRSVERALQQMAEHPVTLGAVGPEAARAAETTDDAPADAPADSSGTASADASSSASSRRASTTKK